MTDNTANTGRRPPEDLILDAIDQEAIHAHSAGAKDHLRQNAGPKQSAGFLNGKEFAPPETLLTTHFFLREFTYSATATKRDIPNHPPKPALLQLARLARVLERCRMILDDRPIRITSGYRCPDLNRAVGGVGNSHHLYGCAADFICPGYGDPQKVHAALTDALRAQDANPGTNPIPPIDDLGLEFKRWIHLAIPRPVQWTSWSSRRLHGTTTYDIITRGLLPSISSDHLA